MENTQNFYENRGYRARGNRGYRGDRGGRGRGRERGNRGGRRNFEHNQEYIETHIINDIPAKIENETENTQNVLITTHKEDRPSENIKVLHEETPKEILTIQEENSPLENQDNNKIILNPIINNFTSNLTNEIQNVESFFQKFTLDKENEVNNLFEEKKVAKEINQKEFYEKCLNYFIRDIQIDTTCNFCCKSSVKSNKNSINSQPQVNYSQSSTTSTTSTTTNKNFPNKTNFNQNLSQNPEPYYGQQPMMYPMYYPQTNSESNMTNPQFYPQMMPPQMMYFMSQMVNFFVKFSINSKCKIQITLSR